MPKRRERQNHQNQRGDDDSSAGKRSRPEPRRRKKHLYVVLDDWKRGLTVHKIDTESFDSDDDDSDRSPRVPVAGGLPEPPVLRLEEAVHEADMLFTAIDSKIFAFTDAGRTPALVYDTETAGLAIGPAAPAHLECGFTIVVAARGTLYAFSAPARDSQQSSIQVMSWAPRHQQDNDDTRYAHYPSEDQQGRSCCWTSLPPGPPPPSVVHDFDPPFVDEFIISYAVHSDGRTIFMTTSCRRAPNTAKSTYSFNTKYRVWRWHDWALPFLGQGHFDSELDAWVGLNKDDDIVCCQVPSDIGSETPVELGTTVLDWQVVLDDLFPKNTERHLCASLTYMGRSKFCLVQSVIRKGAKERYLPLDDDDDGCLLHLTMFGLKYSHRGELRATSHRSTCSYRVSRHRDCFSPEAFWV